ncbi:MAG TPA: IS630 family transposase [Chloroflexota bacterium]|nr:IS630 family transposase [Chloroflexota bacterium]
MQDAPETVIVAEDEARLYLQATTMRVWVPRGQTPVVRADAGRAKTCFYGSLNLRTGMECVTQCQTMNAEASANHLKQLLTMDPDVPILLLWDRAPWHSGEAIREVLAAHPRLEIVRLPVAAPDLNPQEHVWKATREAVSHNHALTELPTLGDHFEHHLKHTRFPSSFLTHRGFYSVYPRSIC